MDASSSSSAHTPHTFFSAQDMLRQEHPSHRPAVALLKEETKELFTLFFKRVALGESPILQDVFATGARRLKGTVCLLPQLFIGWCACGFYPSETRTDIARHLVEKLTSDTEVATKIEESGSLSILSFGSGFGLQSLLELFLILEKYKGNLKQVSITFADTHYTPLDPSEKNTPEACQFNAFHLESTYHISLVLNQLEEMYHIPIEARFTPNLEGYFTENPNVTYDLISSIDVLSDRFTPKEKHVSGKDVCIRNVPSCVNSLRKVLATSPEARFFTSFTDPSEDFPLHPTASLRRFNKGIDPFMANATRTTTFFGKLPVGLHLLDMYFPKNDRVE